MSYPGSTSTPELSQLNQDFYPRYKLGLSSTPELSQLNQDFQGLRAAASASTSSFNPLLRTAVLWTEMDCGVFFRKHLDWPACSRFIDEAQQRMEVTKKLTPK